jgi:hypothetical protein
MAGLIYSSGESSRIQDLLSTQEAQMSAIDKEKSNTDKTVLRYTIIVAGAVLLLVLLKLGISYKKK